MWPQELVDRFHSKTSKAPNGCILWTAGKFKCGYGGFWAFGAMRYAHRIAWEAVHGPILDSEMQVLHRCDNPICVNPGHLFLGTIADNMRDKETKGRGLSGERCNTVKLKVADVEVIKKSRLPATELAQTYKVTWRTIYHIRAGKTWRSV